MVKRMCTNLFEQLGLVQEETDDVFADQTNATIDPESGAIYSYVPAEQDGDAFMFEIHKAIGESESLQFKVGLHHYLLNIHNYTCML